MRKKNGQSLLELLFVVAIISITVVGIVGLSTRTISNQNFAQNKALATEYGQQAMEWIRSERDSTDWSDFNGYGSAAPGTVYCLKSLNSSLWSDPNPTTCNLLDNTIFTREASLVLSAPSTMDIEVRVKWSDSQGAHTVTSDTTLTDWRR